MGDARQQRWQIEFTPEALRWFRGLGKDAERFTAAFDAIQSHGSDVGRPFVERVKGSRHHNMKEVRSTGRNFRALFAFDPRRHAIVLLGGDKTNDWKGWYQRNIPRADELYDRHLWDLGVGGGASVSARRLPGRPSGGRCL